ncbi:hypothetical protein PILCRDRAFT_652748 [Piloderma croceum F 1598]|uniref:RRM domain-containing protein n=1 Tax=Piloderma croceum (strain F 1598) TaxID=765440 RepID=A0A0C3F933_PILCF|nr:hypothetical protein PILCRDRAFT_652748 [Piloderma croceum F 1598]
MDATDQDYLKKREALFQDSLRDQRIHQWISSQYDFALSEFENENDIPPPSRADSPLLGFPDGRAVTPRECPSYEPLFFSDPSQDNLSTADQQFEDGERERALKFLIKEMNLVFPSTGGPAQRHTAEQPQCDVPEGREKSLPPLPPRAPPSSPESSPAQSRRPSHSHTLNHTSSRTRLTRLPSISATLGSPPNPVLQVEDVLYIDTEPDTPTPTATPVPTRAGRTPAPLKLSSTFEAQRAIPPSSPTMTTTTNASTPALSPSSISYPQPQQIPHTRSTSFPDSLFTASSGPASPTSSAYMTPDSNWTVPTVITSGNADDGVLPPSLVRINEPKPVFPSQIHEHGKLGVPNTNESRWSLASSNQDEDGYSPSSETPKSPSKRKRLLSLISLLSPSGREAKENRPVLIQPRTTPPSPTSSSIYLADVVTANTSSSSNDFGLPSDDPNYNPYYDHSTFDSSSASNKKNSLTSLGYASRSFAKPKKRTLVVGGVKENDARTFSAVQRWCESFGELRSMSRKPNGDIYVDFRKSSVAETVCRVRGHVALNGANVHLSWFSGKKVSRI